MAVLPNALTETSWSPGDSGLPGDLFPPPPATGGNPITIENDTLSWTYGGGAGGSCTLGPITSYPGSTASATLTYPGSTVQVSVAFDSPDGPYNGTISITPATQSSGDPGQITASVLPANGFTETGWFPHGSKLPGNLLPQGTNSLTTNLLPLSSTNLTPPNTLSFPCGGGGGNCILGPITYYPGFTAPTTLAYPGGGAVQVSVNFNIEPQGGVTIALMCPPMTSPLQPQTTAPNCGQIVASANPN
jgi:hypothetical protein